MYSKPTRNSKPLRTFYQGKILKYYTYTSNWYKSYVKVNGVTRTVYINKVDVENAVSEPDLLKGIALKNPTKMYSEPTKNSSPIRSFYSGKELKYYTYSTNWYKSYVKVNGKDRAIYINKDDVEGVVSNPKLSEGIAWKSVNKVYELPSRNSKVLRTFERGKILKFYTYSDSWYKSSVLVNGKPRTIYINKADIERATPSNQVLQGLAKHSVTNVYAKPTGYSKVLRKYKKGSVLRFYDYSPNWYKSTVYVPGIGYQVCYIKKSDIEPQRYVYYDLTLDEALDMQMGVSPVTDLGLTRGWKKATREQIEYYLNPQNFYSSHPEYLQFLILSSYSGTTASELNKFLKGKGVLEGKGAAFIEAAKKYNINELTSVA